MGKPIGNFWKRIAGVLYPRISGDTIDGTAITGKVNLQATTPGTTQTGNLNISGTGILGTGVGVGTGTGPATALEVTTILSTSPRGMMSSQFGDDTNGARLHMRKGRGTRVAPTIVVTADMLGRLVGSGYDGAAYQEMVGIDFMTRGTIAAGRIPTQILLKTAADNAATALVTKVQIDDDVTINRGHLKFTQESAPGACTAAESATAGIVTAGNHLVKITFVTASGETEPGTASGTVASDGSHKIGLTAIPTGTAGVVSSRKVYMTKAGGTTYYYIDTIADNTTTTYSINLADASLVTTSPARNTTCGGIYSGGTKRIHVDPISARVGIHTDQPGAALDVVGAMQCSQDAHLAIGNYNASIGNAAFGTSMTKGLSVAVGVAPSAVIAGAQLFVQNLNGASTGGFQFMNQAAATAYTVVGCSGVTAAGAGAITLNGPSATPATITGWMTVLNHLGVPVYVPYLAAIP